jgi:hypothetical protein
MPIKPEMEIEALAQQFMQPGPLSNDDRRQKPLKLPDIKDATGAPVYHFTTTLQLPWIAASGELQPSPSIDVGIGPTNLLWATAKRAGDKTSWAAWTAKQREAVWRADLFRLVRFTLPAKRFLTWGETVRQQGWTAHAVVRLMADDRWRNGEDGHAQWHCRADPLPLSDVLECEARSYAGRWRPIELDPGRVVQTGDPGHLGYRLGRRKTLFAIRELITIFRGDQIYGFRPAHLDRDEWAGGASAAQLEAEEVHLDEEDPDEKLWDAALAARWEAEEDQDDDD